MDAILQFLIDWGYVGMFLSALIAGTVVPFSSEAVLVALISMGLNPIGCILTATAGNMIGGMTCYWLGSLGNMLWIEKYFGVNKKKLERAERFVKGRGAWMAFFMFIPFLGEAIGVVLGLMRANVWITAIAMFLGKSFRYIALALTALGITSLF
ncbi:MAG: DedA family protein [Bacteroides sp.]|nr:DedA family protein [Bacteroidaceae bacterium]MBO5507334.1 DedA family protein [Bacteroides sp.]